VCLGEACRIALCVTPTTIHEEHQDNVKRHLPKSTLRNLIIILTFFVDSKDLGRRMGFMLK